MAPEQLESPRAADHRADIYAVGVVLFEMLVGTPPSGSAELPLATRPGTHERLDGVVLRASKPDVHRRYQKIADLKGDLIRILWDQLVRALRSGDDEARKAEVVQGLGDTGLLTEVLGLAAQEPGGRTRTPEKSEQNPWSVPWRNPTPLERPFLYPPRASRPGHPDDERRGSGSPHESWFALPAWLVPASMIAMADLMFAFLVVTWSLYSWDVKKSRPAAAEEIERPP